MSAVPFKANAKCRHHIPKQKRRLTNWPAYEASLRQRGDLTVVALPQGKRYRVGFVASPKMLPVNVRAAMMPLSPGGNHEVEDDARLANAIRGRHSTLVEFQARYLGKYSKLHTLQTCE
jgi:hypothetical protein